LAKSEAMMTTIPYIHFQGQCAEAMTFYAQVFASPDLQMMRYTDGPPVPAEWADSPRIMHAQMTIDDGSLMASDYPPGMVGEAQRGVSVMQSAADVATGQRIFDALAQGGSVIEAFKPTFFSPGFGMLQDRFGTHWIISTVPAAP
jgi:PhnB protein